MIQSVKCLPRKILNSDSQNPHKNWPDTTPPVVSALGRQRSRDPGIHWPTSIAKQRAPGSVKIRAKEEDVWGQTLVSVCTCTPPQTCTHSWELVHMNIAPPPKRGRERSKGVGVCTVSGGQWSWFLSFYLYVAFGTQTQVARLVWQTPFAYWATLPALFLSWKSLTRWFRPAINSEYSGLSPTVLRFQARHQVQ